VLDAELPPADKIEDFPAEREILNKVWVSFDHVGLMISFKLVSKKMVFEMYYDTIINCWETLKPYIQREREIRQGRYQEYFEKLYIMSVKFRDKNYPE
jgi:hypothetical protein